MKQDSGSGGLEQFETTVSSRVARGVLGNNDSESRTRAEREQIKTTSLGCGRGYSLKKQQIMLTKWLRWVTITAEFGQRAHEHAV